MSAFGTYGILDAMTVPTPDVSLTEHHVLLPDGTPVLIRPLVVEDAGLYPDFLGDVSGEDLRLRFFERIREVNPKLLDKLIHYDPAHAMAFIALDERTKGMLGV